MNNRRSTIGCLVLLACANGCTHPEITDAASDAATETGIDTQSRDVLDASNDHPQDPCAGLRYSLAGRPSPAQCLPIEDAWISYQWSPTVCTAYVTAISAADPSALASIVVTDMGNPFAAAGDGTAGIVLDARGADFCGTSAADCDFVGSSCEFTVLRGGGVGDLVEATLARPCALLRRNDSGGMALPSVTIDRLDLLAHIRLGPILAAGTCSPTDGGAVSDDACPQWMCREYR